MNPTCLDKSSLHTICSIYRLYKVNLKKMQKSQMQKQYFLEIVCFFRDYSKNNSLAKFLFYTEKGYLVVLQLLYNFYQSKFLAWPTQPVRSWSVESITPTMARLMHVPNFLFPISILSTFLIANQTISWLLVPVLDPNVFSVFLKKVFIELSREITQ